MLTGRKLFSATTPLATINQAREQAPPKTLGNSAHHPARSGHDLLEVPGEGTSPEVCECAGIDGGLGTVGLAGKPIRARRVGLVERVGLWCWRKPAMAGMAGAALAAMLVVSGLAVWRVSRARQQEALERYAANISLADSSIRQGSTDLAFEYLMKCPEPFRRWEWGHLLFECLQEVSTIPAHTNRPQWLQRPLIEQFGLSDDGKRLWTRGLEGSMVLWDPIQGRELFRIGDETNRVIACSVRPGGKEIAVARSDGSLEILDTNPERSYRACQLPFRRQPTG